MTKKEIIDYIMETPQNTNPAILSQMLDEIAGEGGGDGYLGLHTATVNVTFDTSEIEGDVTEFENVPLLLESNESGSASMSFSYGLTGIPVAELGDVTHMLIPVTDGYLTIISPDYLSYLASEGAVIVTEITAVSGAVTQLEYGVAITGDCSLNIKVIYQNDSPK